MIYLINFYEFLKMKINSYRSKKMDDMSEHTEEEYEYTEEEYENIINWSNDINGVRYEKDVK